MTSDSNPYLLPEDLPVPANDGACDHLTGMRMASIALTSTRGRFVNVADISRTSAVFFFYPETGRPGDPIPNAWNKIPGARGCTPQSCAFRDNYRSFKELGFEVFGVSAQSLDDQIEFAKHNRLPYELLNDSDFKLTSALRLPTFKFESKTFLKRFAIVAKLGRIQRVFYPVFPPDKNAEQVLDYLRASTTKSYAASPKVP